MKQLLANLNWFGKVLFSLALAASAVLGWNLGGVLLYDAPPKPKELTPLDLSVILTEKVNKQNAQIRQLKTELDQVKRQLAGELPQIHGGVSYEKDSIEND